MEKGGGLQPFKLVINSLLLFLLLLLKACSYMSSEFFFISVESSFGGMWFFIRSFAYVIEAR